MNYYNNVCISDIDTNLSLNGKTIHLAEIFSTGHILNSGNKSETINISMSED
jgi:hypothetical protein